MPLLTVLIFRSFRNFRLLALSRVLSSQALGSPALRVKPEALLLTAASLWLVNSLHARPDDGPASRNLMEAVLPLTDTNDPDQLIIAFHPRRRGEGQEEEESDDEEDSDPALPYHPYGVIFLRRIMLDNVPRMRAGGGYLNPAAFRCIFGDTPEGVEHTYYTVGIIPASSLAGQRVVTNKSKRTPTFIIAEAGPSRLADRADGADDMEVDQPANLAASTPLFNLAEKGLQLPPPAVDSGSDMEELSEEQREPEKDIDQTITDLFRQFMTDMMVKVPNPRGSGNPSYCLLDRDARLRASEDLFKNGELSDIWRACQYKVGSREDFNLVLYHLFPPCEHKTGKVQNYRQCQYYIKWKTICATAKPNTVNTIHLAIKQRIDKFTWLPHACQDKMWPTKALNGFTRYPPDSKGPAPRILHHVAPLF